VVGNEKCRTPLGVRSICSKPGVFHHLGLSKTSYFPLILRCGMIRQITWVRSPAPCLISCRLFSALSFYSFHRSAATASTHKRHHASSKRKI